MSKPDFETHDPNAAETTAPLVGTIIGKSVVVVRHAENLTLTATHGDAPPDAAPTIRPPQESLQAVERALIAGSGSIRFGDWVVEVGSVDVMQLDTHVHETHVHQAAPDADAVLAAVREVQRGVDADTSLRSLRDYIAAVRQACSQASYVSLRSSPGLAAEYVPLAGSIPQQSTEIADAVLQVGSWISSDAVRSVYVEGGPGTGKTTALYRLASQAWDNPEAVGLDRPHLPMLVRLRHLGREPGVSPEERLWAAVRAAGELMITGDVPAPGFMADWSRRMDAPWLILLDAFDELPARDRAKARLWLAALHQFERFRIVITTRQLALLGGPLLDISGVEQLVVRELPEDRQRLLSARILGDRADDFWAEVERAQLEAVMTTPFDVTIATALYRSGRALPQSRAHLIHHFIESVLEEARIQGLDDQVDADALGSVLDGVALASGADGCATFDVALDVVIDVLARLHGTSDPVLVEERAKRLLSVLADRSGVFRMEGDVVAWSHALFGDLLSARAIARRYASTSGEGIETATKWFDQNRRTALFFLLAIWSDRRGFGLRGPASDATGPIAAILDEEQYDLDPSRVADVSQAFIEGARASEALEQRVVDIMTGNPEPFGRYDACERVFAARDLVSAVEALARVPRFVPRFGRLAEWASEWVHLPDDRRAHAGAAVLGFTGRWRELLAAADHNGVPVRNVAIGAAKLADAGFKVEASRVLEAVQERVRRNGQANGIVGT